MSLKDGRAATRLPAQGGLLYQCASGMFALFESAGSSSGEFTHPSKGGKGEHAAWFRDSEGNMLGIGEAIR